MSTPICKIWDADQGKYVGIPAIKGPKGDPGAPGKNGHSPVVTAAKSGKTTTISVDGAAIATVEDGSEGAPVNWRGAWKEDTEYSKLDAVSYDGSSYIFTSDTHVIGSIPGVDEEWGLMAQKGNDGATKTIVDTAMSDTSTNPVQNKVIKKYIDGKVISGGSGSSNILTSPVMICKPGEEGSLGIYMSTIDTGEKQAEIKFEDANENSSVAISNLRTPTGANASDYAATKGYVDSKIPTTLKNPNALTIKIGSTTVTYDGSTAQTVTIADGSEVAY